MIKQWGDRTVKGKITNDGENFGGIMIFGTKVGELNGVINPVSRDTFCEFALPPYKENKINVSSLRLV